MEIKQDSVVDYDLQVVVVDLTLSENKEEVYSKMYKLILMDETSTKVQIWNI